MSVNYNYLETKNEMRKIQAYSCGDRQINITPQERAEIEKAVAREREYLTAEQARAAARAKIKRRMARECCLYCIRFAFEDPTIYYRFADQSYCNNITGRANINITELARKSLSEPLDFEDILKKYRARA